MREQSKYENPSIDDIVAWLYGDVKKNYDSESVNRIEVNVEKKIKEYTENALEDYELYEEDFADAIRSHDSLKIRFLSELTTWYMKFYPGYIFYVNEQLPDVFEDSKKNVLEILNIIYNHRWEEKWSSNDIFEEDFKKICTIPVLLPICQYAISGEYIIYVLQKDKLRFYHSDESDSSQYMRFYHSYMNDFEKYLSISMERVFTAKGYAADEWINILKDEKFSRNYALSKEYYQMERTGTKGEDFFYKCDYVSYELRNKKRKYNFLSMFEDSKTHDILPYIDPVMRAVLHGKFELNPKHRERFLFKTLMLQNIPKEKRRIVQDAILKPWLVILANSILISRVRSYVECLVIAKRTAHTTEQVNKYDRLLSDYKCYVENQLTDMEVKFQKSKEKDDIIFVQKENLYETVLWKLHMQEYEAMIAGIEQAYRLPSQTHNRVDVVLDYIRLHSEECISVRSWSDFEKKYNAQLKDFFPNLSNEELEVLWFQTINLVLCLFPKLYSISIDEKILPRPQNPITQKWLDNNEIDIGSIKSRDLFSLMHLMEVSSDWIVATKGKNTSFYYAPRKEGESLKPSDKPLKTILKNSSTHFSSEQAPHYNDVLILQALLWGDEQRNGFFMSKDWLDFFRRSLCFNMNVIVYHIFHANSVESCIKRADAQSNYIMRSLDNFLSRPTALSKEDPFLRRLFEVAGLYVEEINSKNEE